ncbi:norsolorinic acid ketoreductase [Aureococcus anophagefferens]|uniref:Norsolorinic acid ketoreductase n=1 Tax=Aureococcus anophagefferens TaxID=44056 RepID=A0ABR1FYY9_AURAN|nr:hypothetical protein JL721_4895 [Aureococcus anophagefferens]
MGLLRRLVLLLAALRAAALTVLITGGNGGIGTELAVEFARAGHSVISACRGRSAHVHERLVEEQLEARVRIILGLDVLDDAKTDAFFDALQAEGVVLDVLVATWQLAVDTYPGTTEPMQLGGLDLKLLEKVFAANAVGPVRVTEAVLKRRLLRSPGGKIAHVSSKLGSIASNTATGQNYAYRMSKSALNAAGKSMAVDLRPQGIAVALLHPGYVATPMTGDRGDLTAAASAAGLYRRIVDDLDLAKSGTFFDTDGSALPW